MLKKPVATTCRIMKKFSGRVITMIRLSIVRPTDILVRSLVAKKEMFKKSRICMVLSALFVVGFQAASTAQTSPTLVQPTVAEEQEEESFEIPEVAPSFTPGLLASRYGSRAQSKSDVRMVGDPLSANGMVSASGGGSMAQIAGQPSYYVYEFGAKWCPSCRDLAPLVMAVASKYQGFVQVIPVDIDTPSAKQLVQRLGLRAVPTVIISDRQGNQLQTLVGLQQGMKLDKILNDYRRRASSGPGAQ